MTTGIQQVEVDSVFAEYLPDELESKADVDEAFRKAAKDLHPDQSGGDTAEAFDTARKERERLKELDHGLSDYEVVADQTGSDVSLPSSLEAGMETYFEDDSDLYDVEMAESGGVSSALLSDPDTNLKVGLEIEFDETILEANATYFADGHGELEKISGHADLEKYVDSELDKSNSADALEQGLKDVGSWAVSYAEEEVKPKYS